MKTKLTTILFAVILLALPVLAVTEDQATLDKAMADARVELKRDYVRRQRMQERMSSNFEHQHGRMLSLIKKCNELSVMLYLQKKEYTFDLSYALQQVTDEYQDFNKKRTPYDRIVADMDLEIDRYARLIESMRRLPPALDSAVVAFPDDSLRFHNDSLENHIKAATTSLEEDLETLADTVTVEGSPFFLSRQGQTDRDTSMYYASEILRMYVDMKATMVADSTHYQEAYLRLKESYDYAKDRYMLLQREIFRDGQAAVWDIAARPQFYKRMAQNALTRRETDLHMTTPLWTFFWLLLAIAAALMVRIRKINVRKAVWLLLPTVVVTLVVIFCRITFMPNILMNLLFPIVMTAGFIWQALACTVNFKKVDKENRSMGLVSLLVMAASALAAIFGYIFIALMIVTWWYFQLAAVLALLAVSHLMGIYKEKRLTKRIARFQQNITFVTGTAKKSLMFGATWFYDLLRDVVVPVLILVSIPLCVRYSLDIFDFDDLFQTFYNTPFFQVIDPATTKVFFRLSVSNIVLLVALYFVFNYINKFVQTLWQYLKFITFLAKTGQNTVQANEINLSLGKSIISVIVWFTYITVIVLLLRIPTGSLGLVAGGLSAGIGLAMKDILNNFIYGIQLMSGRLRVGDWIECDGIRGKVTDINYQTTQIETVSGTLVAFLNANLFGKSFQNLTRNNEYEFTKVTVGVAYGVDIEKVRKVLLEALEQLKTKDKYGREIIEPKFGINIRFGDFGDSSVEIAVKQFVLVPERGGFIDKEKEIIYKALNAAGITIPFPQCDVHLIKDE
ncbi:MAG: mechanosensitive ion channel family protein [Bacteroidales bacterium]|nr:mechanosensitive ion channel family protein [Bacteroidales bacterium]